MSSQNYNKKNWNSRRQSERSVDDEPEWFTAGPTSRLDTIELKGFEGELKQHFFTAKLSQVMSVVFDRRNVVWRYAKILSRVIE